MILLCGSASLVAQDAPPDLAELRATLQRLDEEAARERAALEASEQDLRSKFDRAAAEREAAAERVLDLAFERESLLARRRAQEERAAALEARRDRQLRTLQAWVQGARDLCEHLVLHLAEVAGTGSLEQQVRELLPALSGHEPKAIEAIEASLTAFDRAHRQAASVQIRSEKIWTALGLQEDCELLSVGHLFFAYRTIRDDRIGLALAAPADTKGFRYTEELPAETRQAIAEAFERTARRDVQTVEFPVDPSGSLRVEGGLDQPSFFLQLQEGGLVMIPLALVGLLCLVLLAERSFVLFLRCPLELPTAKQVLQLCAQGEMERARALCENGRGMVLRTLGACLQRRTQGARVLEDTVQERLLHELPRLRRSMGGIASLAAVAPLLGLLGTVTGIIRTFGVIKAYGNSNPALMAGGISEALLTTAVGMCIAIPVLLLHTVLRARVDHAVAETERHAASLLTLLAQES